LKTGHICPYFKWSISLDHFIQKENFSLYIKSSSLAGKSPAQFSHGQNKIAAITIQKPGINVIYVNGPLA
jgi:hypothetical protein